MSPTRHVWHRSQLLRPVFGDLDGLMFHGLTLCRVPLLICMIQDLLQVVRIQGVEDVEEVISWWSFAGWVLIREVRHEDRVLLELRIQCFDG
jgi:hypothetical protein